MPSHHLILCLPHLLLPSVFDSIRVFSSESVLPIRWAKYWSLSFSISLSNEYSELISFRIAWFNFVAVQGTLKRLLQHHSSKASNLQHSVFLMVWRSKHLLILWLQSPFAVILGPKKIKSVTISIVSPSTCQEIMWLVAMIFFLNAEF